MITFIHNQRRLPTGMESPGCPEQQDMARSMDLRTMGGDPCEPHLAQPRVEDGGDNGDDGDDHGVAIAIGDGGYGVNDIDLEAIVDGILADLPEPARYHILPEIEDRAWPVPYSAI